MSAPGLPYSVEVVLSGFMEMRLKSNGLDPALQGLFYTEMRVMLEQIEYWLPVRKTVIPHLKNEFANSKPVTLFLIWPGKTGADWVFVVNEFDAGRGAKE